MPLEVSSEEPQPVQPDSTDAEAPVAGETKLTHPQRRSKEKAREQISTWVRDLGGPEDVGD